MSDLTPAPSPPELRDAHGFLVPHNLVTKYRALQTRQQQGEITSANWPELLEQAKRKSYRVGGPLPPKFAQAVSDGIPHQHRPAAWMLLSGAQARKDAQPHLFERIVSTPPEKKVADAIELDVRRTFPEHPRLTSAFVERMRTVLLAYAKRNPEVGYCQGMNFVVASILLVCESNEDSFWLLAHIVEEVLPDHYVQSMIGHTVDRQVTEQLVEHHLPQLAKHLRDLQMSMPFVTTHWFLCLFVTALPSESAFRLWDLILCLDAAWTFRASLALFAMMEAQDLLETHDLGTAVFVIKSSTRAAFDANEIIELANGRFGEIGNELIIRLRREWRKRTMEQLHAKLRVKELYEAQQQVTATFAVEQAKSLLLSLRLEGQHPDTEVTESELIDALGRVLPEEETKVVLAFLVSTAAAAAAAAAAAPSSSSSFTTPVRGAPSATPSDGGFVASQVAVGMAVLCDGAVDERLRMCFEAYDHHCSGVLDGEAIVSLMHAIYRTYYKQPPTDAEVRTAAEVMFLNVASPQRKQGGFGNAVTAAASAAAPADNGSTIKELYGGVGGVGGTPVLSVEAFVVLAAGQPTLVQCFATRGNRPLLTPRGVDQRRRMPREPSNALETILPFLMPNCAEPRKRGAHIQKHHSGPLRDDKLLAKAVADPNKRQEGLLGLGVAMIDGIHTIGASVLSGTTDVFGGMGGALDGALGAMDVPLKRNPMGLRLKDADELSMALSEAGLEPPDGLRIALGFDCTAHNRRAGRHVFSGRPLHASNTGGVLGPDPNPYQLAIFMLGKALESVGLPIDTPVRCFCYNTMPPQPGEALGPPPDVAPSPPPRPPPPHDVSDPIDESAPSPPPGKRQSKWAQPVVTVGMEGALSYYNSLPPYIFRGARGSGAAGGLAQAVAYGASIANQDAADGATRTLLLLLTPGQGIDTTAAREALHAAHVVPMSVVAIGVGDGPFYELGRLAASAPHNCNAVDFHNATSSKFPDRALALEAFRVLPEQAELSAILQAARLQQPASHDAGAWL